MEPPGGKPADPRRRSAVSRREYLRTASAAGIGCFGLSATVGRAGAAASRSHTLTIRGTGPPASYGFSVSDDLEKSTANGANINPNDGITGSTATGEVGVSADSYAFSGSLESFRLDGDADITLDGDRIDPGEYPDHAVVIAGTGPRATYVLSTSDDLAKATVNGANTNENDGITGSTATGEVGISADSYAFSGSLESFRLDGDANVALDGDRIDPGGYPDHVLTISGTGPRATYEVTVSGDLEKSIANGANTNDNDGIDGSNATGEVGISADSYAFSGKIREFVLYGDANVFFDGEGVDPDSLGDSGGADLELGYDARARSHRRGRTYENFGDFSKGWYPTNGELSSDTEWRFDDDSPASARLDGYADDDRIGMAVDFEGGKSFVGYDLSLAVRLGEAAHETLRVELWAQDAADQYVATRYLSRADDWVRIDLGPTSVSGSPNFADVRRFGIECYTGGKRVRMNIDAIRTMPRRDSGAVILTFDDNHHTHYDLAFQEMQHRGMVGTVGVIHDLVGDPDRISFAEMREMQAAGWTMASHPQGDDPSEGLGRVSRERAERMIRETKGWLVEHGFAEGARCLIWPFGNHDHDSLELAGEYHELSFGGGSSPSPGVVTEAAWVPRVNADEVPEALDAIDAAARFDQVLMLMVHTIGEGRISTNDFERLLDRIEARDLDVLTASDFADEQ